MTLRVPSVLRQVVDTHHAATTYADAGWYVLPVRTGKVKHAGSVLGQGWPEKSSQDRNDLDAWFGSGGHGIALHVGRSGAICFDVDEPAHLPRVLLDAFATMRPAFQSTRVGDDVIDPCRGHYLFALPDGVMLGNSLGRLRTDPKWGDVRGRNGIVVVSPTWRPEDHKRYHWVRTGTLPELPRAIARELINSRRGAPPTDIRKVPVGNRVHGVLSKLTGAQQGERNSLLFWCACRLGEMITDGLISEQAAFDVLTDVATELGLGTREVTGTVASGLRTGSWVAGT